MRLWLGVDECRGGGHCLCSYAAEVEMLLELPDLPLNAGLLDFLRGQASPPSGPGDYTLGPPR